MGELEKMLLLVLGCAVTCQGRGRHIRKILEFEMELKTKILLAVSSLELEVAYLNIKIVEKKAKELNEKDKLLGARKDSNDSGIVDDDDNEVIKQSDEKSTIITKSDFCCQHDGFFETTFDTEDNDTNKREVNYIEEKKPIMKDFECQFESPTITSAIVDIDDTLGIKITKDAATDPEGVTSVDTSTDPVFQDMITILSQEQKVAEMEKIVLEQVGKDAIISDMEKKILKWERKCGAANSRYRKVSQEVEALRLALMIAKGETDNLRKDLNVLNDHGRVDERVGDLQSKLDSALSENAALVAANKELEDKVWCLELDQKRQSYHVEQSTGLRRLMVGDCVSSISSGFVSGDQSNTTGLIVTQDTRDMREEAERLSELIGVMEVREEQLLEQVEEAGLAKEKAEEKIKEKDWIITRLEQRSEMGRKVKNALLLTAAFGAVHTAIQQDMVMGCLPM